MVGVSSPSLALSSPFSSRAGVLGALSPGGTASGAGADVGTLSSSDAAASDISSPSSSSSATAAASEEAAAAAATAAVTAAVSAARDESFARLAMLERLTRLTAPLNLPRGELLPPLFWPCALSFDRAFMTATDVLWLRLYISSGSRRSECTGASGQNSSTRRVWGIRGSLLICSVDKAQLISTN